MRSKGAKKLIDDVEFAISEINNFSLDSDLEKSYLAKFLVVYICGIYEEAIESIINQMAENIGNQEIVNFLENSLSHGFRNPDVANICSLLKKFSAKWSEEVKKLPEEYLSALNNIVSHKNSMAHGLASNITLSEVNEYYRDSKKVIEKIDSLVLS